MHWAIVIVLALAACSVNRRTDGLACSMSSQCADGRTCEQGYCVVGTSGSCPGACTSCNASTQPPTCLIQKTGSSGKDLTCPDGYQCDITCTGSNACGDITCSSDQCQVTCTGDSSCGAVDCSSSCACSVTCTGSCGTNSCPTAKNGNACESGGECTTSGPGCNSC